MYISGIVTIIKLTPKAMCVVTVVHVAKLLTCTCNGS